MDESTSETVSEQKRIKTDDRGRGRLGPEHADRTLNVTIEDAYEVTDLPVFHAHYKAHLSVAGTAQMIADRRVGMDHGTGPFDAHRDYSGNPKGDANALRKAARVPCLIVGAASHLAPDRRLIGISPPQGIVPKQYEHRSRDEEGDEDIPDAPLSPVDGDLAASRELLTQKPGSDRVWMKTVQLDPERTVVVTEDEAPAIWKNPPQGTIVERGKDRWQEVYDAFRDANYPAPL